jgi:hypothetical protein
LWRTRTLNPWDVEKREIQRNRIKLKTASVLWALQESCF